MNTSRFDGNALAGPLSALFSVDATMLALECAGCGTTALLAEAVVERDDRAAIVRCRSCTHTLFTLLDDEDGFRIVVESLRSLRLDQA